MFFRIGGAGLGKATTSLVVNRDNGLLDDIWAWRADHGNGVGWTANTADTGVIVNGDDVTAYGLFVAQTSADRAGLDFVIDVGLEHGGFGPRGRRAEDGRIPDITNQRATDRFVCGVTPRFVKNLMDSYS